MGKQWKQWQTVFLGSQITADGDCSHEIKRHLQKEKKKKKRHLLLGRKAMTNLDSILKSRDVADKGPSSQSYGFSSSHVWMWELNHNESWMLKNWCLWTVVLEKTLESPLDCKLVNPKGNQSWIFIRRTDIEAEAPVLWPPDAKSWLIGKDPDAGKDWRQEEKGTTEDEMVGWHHRLSGHEFEQDTGGGGGQGGLACSPWGHKELDTTERRDKGNNLRRGGGTPQKAGGEAATGGWLLPDLTGCRGKPREGRDWDQNSTQSKV